MKKMGNLRKPSPKNAIKEPGGKEYKRYDNKYLVWEQNKLILSVKGEDGRIYRQDIFGTVKFFTPKRFTKKFRDELRLVFENSEFRVEKSKTFYNDLYKIV